MPTEPSETKKPDDDKPTTAPDDKAAANTWGQNPTLGNEINPSDVIEQQKKS